MWREWSDSGVNQYDSLREKPHYLTGFSAEIKDTLWCIIVTLNKIDAWTQNNH